MTIANTSTDETPRAWVGSLGAYNAGNLIGRWFDAVDCDDITADDVYRGSGLCPDGDEELWVFDHENIPVSGEMSPYDAAEWGRTLAEVPDHQRAALCAWVRSGVYVAEGTGDLPSVSDFEERYAGHWDGFAEYAHQLAEDIGLLADVPEEVARYFDWAAWSRDLALDHTTEADADGGVHVFRSL